MKISPTEILQNYVFYQKFEYRLSYNLLSYKWILGFISSFSRIWGLSVKISPTERSWERSNYSKEYDNISLSVIFHLYHYLISKNRKIDIIIIINDIIYIILKHFSWGGGLSATDFTAEKLRRLEWRCSFLLYITRSCRFIQKENWHWAAEKNG